jgi:DNA-binding response OmpR family regulator
MSTTVLLAGGETGASSLLERRLRECGFEIARDGDRADVVIAEDSAQLERWRVEAPVIVLGAPDDEPDDRVLAFRRGCDDYVAPPFCHEELVERIRALLRRVGPPVPQPVVVGGLRIDGSARRAWLHGILLRLAHKEFDLLATLAAEPERVFSKAELLRGIWNWPERMPTRTVDSHACRLRGKLRAVDPAPSWIDNEWGIGYRLLGPFPG